MSTAVAFDDPAKLDLDTLFHDERMFDSRRAWTAAGFDVVARSSSGKIMVARHPSVQGLLFKKYASDVPEADQTENYRRRLEGSKQLRAFADARRLRRVVIPRKWILKLPSLSLRSETSRVLVVEQLDLLTEDQTKGAYRRIDPAVLRELCVVLFHFRGMDSIAKNLPFVADGRIGLVDTEHWDRSTRKPYLHRVGEYLSKDHRKLAGQIFDKLEDGDEDTSDSFDFTDEEDTSTSSSS